MKHSRLRTICALVLSVALLISASGFSVLAQQDLLQFQQENSSSESLTSQTSEPEILENEISTLAMKNAPSDDFRDYLTGFSFTDENSKPFSADNKVQLNSFVTIQYNFVLPNDIDIPAGKTYTIAMPDIFDLGEGFSDKLLVSGNDAVKATWRVSKNGLITIVFPDEIKVSNVSGFMQIKCEVDKDRVKADTIDFDLGPVSGLISRYPVNYTPPVIDIKATLEKAGTFDVNSKIIDWKITAKPTSGIDTLAGLSLKDSFPVPANQELVADSVKINGVPAVLTNTTDGFTFVFPDDTPKGAREITYQTKVTDDFYQSNADQISNHAELIYNGTPLVEKNIDLPIKQDPIKKTSGSFQSGDTSIPYTIEINQDRRGLNNVVVSDFHPLNTTVENAFISYFDTAANQYGTPTLLTPSSPSNVTDGSEQKLKTDFNLGTIDKQAKITYSLKLGNINDFIVDPNNLNKGYSVPNKAELWVDSTLYGTVTHTHGIGVGEEAGHITFTKDGTVMYAKPVENKDGTTIKWTVTINKEKKQLDKEAVFTDTIEANQQYVSDSFEVNGMKQTGVYDDITKQLTYTIPNIGNSAYTITYYTLAKDLNFTANKQTKDFNNQAVLEIAGENQLADKKVTLNSGDLLVKSGTFDYQKKEFNWKINVNQGNLAMNNVSIVDTLPTGQELIPNSITYSVDGTDWQYAVDASNQLTFTYKNGTERLHQAVTITYNTRLTGTEPDQYEVTNTAALTSDITTNINSKVKIPVSYFPAVTKTTPYQKGNTIPWEININKNNAILTKDSAKLVDQLYPGLELKPETVKLYLTSGGKNEVTVPKENIIYDQEINQFTFIMPAGIDRSKSYMLAFSTDVTNMDLKNVSNIITFDGSKTEVEATSSSIPLKLMGSSSGIEGDNIVLTLVKTGKQGTKLKGATFQLLNDAKDKIGSPRTTNENGVVNFDLGLKYAHTYYLVELSAPEGYAASPIEHKIEIGDNTAPGVPVEVTIDQQASTIQHDQYQYLRIPYTLENNHTETKVQKVDSDGITLVTGAELAIYQAKADGSIVMNGADKVLAADADGIPCSWTTDNSIKSFSGLKAGNYVLSETKEPDGYLKAEDIPFTINAYGDILINGTKQDQNIIKMIDDHTKLQVSKISMLTGAELPGAKLEIQNAAGQPVESWTSGDTPKVINAQLVAGSTYTLVETAAPDGYLKAANQSFTVAADGTAQKIVMEDDYTRVKISKTDLTSGTELPGAELTILDGDKNVIEAWTSTDTPHLINAKLIAGETYTLMEKSAPAGYIVAEEISFTVNSDNTVKEVVMADDVTKVEVSKVELGGTKELPGAKLEIRDKDGIAVESWTTEDTPHRIDGKLVAGDTYTLVETAAPSGFTIAANITFTVSSDGSVDKVKMQDTRISNSPSTQVEISKTDSSSNPLPGARLEIRNSNQEVVEGWISSTEPHRLSGRLLGGETYTLVETAAPAGYVIAVPVPFTVDSNGFTTYVKMVDDVTQVEISLIDAKTKIALPGANLSVKDKSGTVVSTWVSSGNPYLITGQLLAGETYTLVQDTVPDHYIGSEPIPFTVSRDGSVVRVLMQDIPKDQAPATDQKNNAGTSANNSGSQTQGTSTSRITNTGDTTPFAVPAILFICSLAGIIIILVKRKKNFKK